MLAGQYLVIRGEYGMAWCDDLPQSPCSSRPRLCCLYPLVLAMLCLGRPSTAYKYSSDLHTLVGRISSAFAFFLVCYSFQSSDFHFSVARFSLILVWSQFLFFTVWPVLPLEPLISSRVVVKLTRPCWWMLLYADASANVAELMWCHWWLTSARYRSRFHYFH